MLITFEGIEGSGKSLQISRSEAYLQKKGIPYLSTREPGGTDFGVAIREILLGTNGCRRLPWCELLLVMADRYQHLKEVIEPALQQGLVVISDRYLDATRAYQGGGRGIPLAEIEKLTRQLGIPEPDKTILLDLDPEVGLSRARKRNLSDASAGAEGRFEAEEMSFHRRVRETYLKLAHQSPQRISIVPASGTPEEIFSRIERLLDAWTKS
jgi:dTMP kinase